MAVIANRCLTCIRMLKMQGAYWMCLGLLVLGFATAAIDASGSCGDISTELEFLRDMDLPDRPTQGPTCGSNSCCGLAEYKLHISSRMEVDKFVKDSVTQVVSLLDTRSRRLEEHFKDMMMRSKKEFHSMFERTYGIIYLKNSDVFTDFFAELEKYYSHGGFSLTETMDHFFSILYQRMFKVINSQYDFDDDYLSCVARDIAKLKPFGDIPTKLAVLLRRSFVATRLFHRALNKGAQIAEKMLKLNVSDKCGEYVTKMQYCDICTNQRGPGPCTPYCTDTLKGCLNLFAELNEQWDEYIDGLDKVADKLLGPFNIEMVVEPINIKISEAIMNFQESGAEVSQKVFVECGAPILKGVNRRRRRDAGPGETKAKEINFESLNFGANKKKKHKKTSYTKQSAMEKKISEVKQKIKETRNFWSHLPYQYCNNVTTAALSEDNTCWNGSTLAAYTSLQPPLKFDKESPILNEQIYNLRKQVYKLKAAYQGQDEESPDDDEENEEGISSGSGSGESEIEQDNELFDVNETTTISTTTTESIVINPSTPEEEQPKVVTATASELTKALAHYILPIVMVWFGSGVYELL